MKSYFAIIKNLLGINTVPFGLIHFVTNSCNLKCDHCFIYGDFDQNPEDKRFCEDPLSLEEIDRMTRSMKGQLQVVSLTGGEPFLRPELLEIARLYVQNAGVQLVEISTNGWYTDRLERFVGEFLRTTGAHLYITLSFDGMRETHDHNRHATGAFDRAVESATRLLSMKKERLTVGGTITVSNQSTEELTALFSFLTNDLKIDSIATAALRGEPKKQNRIPFNASGHRILNDLIQERTLSRDLSLFSRRFGRDLINARGIVARSLVEKMLTDGKYISPCTAGRTFVVMYADGSVYPCEMLPEDKMGGIREFGMDFPALMRCEAARKIRKQIRVGKCFCTFECAYHYNAIFALANWPMLLREYVGIKKR